jgi:ornithine cyclodeaminase/alanine dehydrogenase-like protein (mu-crystallin family)
MQLIAGTAAEVDPVALVAPLRALFVAVSEQRTRSTFGLLDLDDGDVHVKAGHIAGYPVFTVKVASLFPARAAAGGAVAVFSAATGAPLAMIADGHALTDARTAAAGALATDLLADGAADELAVLGAGTQAALQVTTLHALRPLRRVVVWARRPHRAEWLADRLRDRLGIAVEVAGSARRAVAGAPIVITATTATAPLVQGDWLEPGQHITALGADDDRKRELDERCFARADRVVVDSRAQSCRQAELAGALAAGHLRGEDVAELGEVLGGARPGRRAPGDITIAKLTGLAVLDLVAAQFVLDRTEG